ncbi:Serine/threonine-protein phosphatase 2A activator 2 [Gnomoniopsis smithogilvyi]|uniref:Serine/threonine-protein phosphatase 2A activator n=1 Tax=Gnomoniopsis smithogilvyi TaxID=1191159 RepID=A0A9W9D2M0_9PEZI|nr:Serine/threonine-protein phosphatase 2A activator 2 [Gnomoniopsis smithogilvyi]
MDGNVAAKSLSGKGISDLKDRLPKLEPRRRRQGPENPLPLPVTPALPPPPEDPKTFKVPSRRILSPADHELFLKSPTYDLIVAWIFGLCEAIADAPISAIKDDELSGPIKTLLALLDEIEQLVYQSPPDDQGGSRFGNKRFRDFLDKAKAQSSAWHQKLGVENSDAIAELSVYLNQSFGNRKRIDYGSGHELNFMIWLLCLYKLRVVGREDFKPLVLKVFTRYLEVMRVIQCTYYLEPAGSHGVWGLDDYQFLPFLFGAAQLLHHKYITPRAIHQEFVLEQFGRDYLYLNQIVFVNSTKTVKGLRWHSPMLDDISSAKSWEKVEGGMRRMFVEEVLKKLPVMQHFLFGSLVPAAEGMSEQDLVGVPDEEEDDEGGEVQVFQEGGVRHVHQQNGWGECCGIKVPSGVAAGMEAMKQGQSLRRIPFD